MACDLRKASSRSAGLKHRPFQFLGGRRPLGHSVLLFHMMSNGARCAEIDTASVHNDILLDLAFYIGLWLDQADSNG